MIIGLTGRIAAGKGVIAEFFRSKGYIYFSLSTIVREEALKRNVLFNRKNFGIIANNLRKKEGLGILAKKIIPNINPNMNYIIDGIRNPGEIDELRKIDDFILISLDAPQKVRFKRLLKRERKSDPKTFRDFIKIDVLDYKEKLKNGHQVGKCMKMADYKLENDSDLKELNKKIRHVYSDIIKNQR